MATETPAERLSQWTKRKSSITVVELQKLLEEPDYPLFHQLVAELLAEGRLVPIKTSGLNGRVPSLANKYRIIKPQEDYGECLEPIRGLEPTLNIAAYLQRPQYYVRHQEILEGLSRYLWYQAHLLEQPMSRKERSFSIWGKEKLIDEQSSLLWEVLRFNKLPEDFLKYYDTPEPFFEYVHGGALPRALLVIENKDTWFTLRKLLRETGKSRLAGTPVQVLIYGEGNKVTKPKALENYAQEMFGREVLTEGEFLYFGDLDHEGMQLFFRTQRENPQLKLRPFQALYGKMLDLAAERELQPSPDGRNLTVRVQEFARLLDLDPDKDQDKDKLAFLRRGDYIPQEILNYQVLASLLE
ncbi:MAG: hypothetical protein ACRKFN_09690 [Desulfitobacterium sp.]